MDADATSALHKRGIAPTDDSFKFVWFKVSICLFPFIFIICQIFYKIPEENFFLKENWKEEICKQKKKERERWG